MTSQNGVTNGLTNGLTDQLMDNAISRVAFANENCHQVLGSQKLKLTPLETYVYMYYIVIEFGAVCNLSPIVTWLVNIFFCLLLFYIG